MFRYTVYVNSLMTLVMYMIVCPWDTIINGHVCFHLSRRLIFSRKFKNSLFCHNTFSKKEEADMREPVDVTFLAQNLYWLVPFIPWIWTVRPRFGGRVHQFPSDPPTEDAAQTWHLGNGSHEGCFCFTKCPPQRAPPGACVMGAMLLHRRCGSGPRQAHHPDRIFRV